MRATVSNGIGVFYPQGFLDGISSEAILTIEDIVATEHLKVEMLLVSLKKVIFFNSNGLDIFIKMFVRMRAKNQLIVGFCDVNVKKYNAILKFYEHNLNFSIFKTKEIASLFAPSFKNKSQKVLVYSDDKSQRSAMAIELHDNGHNPIIAQTQNDFLEKSESEGVYDFVITETYLGQMGQKIATRVTGNAIIYTISSFLDNEVGNTFNILYHNNSLNVGFRIFIFDAYKVISMNIHALNFFSKLASSAAEYNATICFVGMSFEKTTTTFKDTLEDAGIMFFEQMDHILQNKELLQELGGSGPTTIKQKRIINKAIAGELPRFIDATVATIEMMTNAKAIKEAANVSNINIINKKDKIASSIGFYGDIDGMVILVFPQNIAKKACELLIGEQTDDMELILDSLAELINILGGKIKTLLSDNKINVNITLPRTYDDVGNLLDIIEHRKGVQVDLAFDDDKFIFFLTR